MSNEQNRKIQVVFKKDVDDEAWEVYQRILKEAMQRALDKGDIKLSGNNAEVVRRLIGLAPPDWFVTKEDIKEFRQLGARKTGRVRQSPVQEGDLSESSKKKANGNNK